jgi:hypothetical protein
MKNLELMTLTKLTLKVSIFNGGINNTIKMF